MTLVDKLLCFLRTGLTHCCRPSQTYVEASIDGISGDDCLCALIIEFIFIFVDMDMALDNIVPEHLNWRHTDEGPEYVNAKVSWVRHGYSLFTAVTFRLHFAVI